MLAIPVDVLMLVWSDVSTDARVQREFTTLAAAGHRVHVIGRAVAPDYVPPDGVTVESAGVAPTGVGRRRKLPAPLRAARWILLPQHVNRSLRRWVAQAEPKARARSFDVVHAHDFTALPLGARIARERGVPLVYDAHEFWPGRDRHGRPTPYQNRREKQAEKSLGNTAAEVITVGPELAELLEKHFGWTNVTVVRNTFSMTGARQPPNEPKAAVYAGRIGPGRDLESVVAAAREISPLRTILVGPADGGYLTALPTDGVDVLDALPLDDATTLLADSGIALVTLSDKWLNNRIGMPNKLFMAVRAGVPVVASDLPALRRLVTEYGIGRLYRPGDPASLAAAVREVIASYGDLTAAVVRARTELDWERDAAALLGVYARLGTLPDR
ncbi:MAG: glycosyltransferase [Frankiales bacterium]|nr:glycosyltransferase [Frankiales bacterium]